MSFIRFYATDWMPNGTNMLLAIDREGNIVESLECALFGFNVMPKEPNAVISVLTESDGILELSKAEVMANCVDGEIIREIDIANIFKYIAVSPVSNGSQTIEFVNKYKYWS